MKKIWTRYIPSYPKALLYMLQSSEYKIKDYIRWLQRTSDFKKVMKRRELVWTKKIRLLAMTEVGFLIFVFVFAWFASNVWIPLGLFVILLSPLILAYGLVIPLLIGEVFVQRPREKKIVAAAREQLQRHPAKKIAIAGSYGKTTTRHILTTLLGEKYKVAATPGNMNTLIGTSKFVSTLSGDEQILIFEMGESHVGDIAELCDLVHPDIGVITGINQAHLESFGSIENTISTVFELQDYLDGKPLFKNADDENVQSRISTGDKLVYTSEGIGGWKLKKIEGRIDGTRISVIKDNQHINVSTKLIGEHLTGTLLLAIAVGEYFGLDAKQTTIGLEKVEPFEHRMQPRPLHGALVIDDTYNGNMQGVEAGLKLLKNSGAKRRIYVTPGLVEQGSETESVHYRIGELAAESADIVVLMKNSVTDYVITGLERANFGGDLKIIDDALAFYTGLEHFVATGDVVLMQNDWTDNYA